MNGSRSNSPRRGDRSSLDALNRTIEGLEARIEGLMGSTRERQARTEAFAEPRYEHDVHEPDRHPAPARRPAAPPAAPMPAIDPLAEIRERQRILAATRQPVPARQAEAPRTSRDDRYGEPPVTRTAAPESYRSPVERRLARAERADYAATAAYPERPAARAPNTRDEQSRSSTPSAARPLQRPIPPAHQRPGVSAPAASAPAMSAPAMSANDSAMREIAEALVSLRTELKQDIADGVAREMDAVKSEIRSIRSVAEDQHFTADLRQDFAKLADSIGQLGYGSSPEAADLRAEFEELRSVMDGVAREDSVQRIESRWQGLEERMESLDAEAMRGEIVQLAYRIDDIKSQLGNMSDNPVVRALEQKLISVASAMEQLGTRMQPADALMAEQFSTLDQRLDEISRAIAAGGRAAAAAALDSTFMQRLEGRIHDLGDQIDAIGHAQAQAYADAQARASEPDPAEAVAARIEALTARIEELADEQAAIHLEERLDQLSQMLKQAQQPVRDPELSDYLADISRKIDGLETGSVNDLLAERLDMLARRIDGIDLQPANRHPLDEQAFDRIEDRLGLIAARLDEAGAAPRNDEHSLRNLEDQIAHLSALISQPQPSAGMPEGLENRMAAIESYMSTNDEYIIEAARQAAEAVVEAYSHNVVAGATIASGDMAALSALAEDLRHLEALTRGTEERTHNTFEALHGTLVQIADRLDTLDERVSSAQLDVDRQERVFGRAEPAQRTNHEPAVAEWTAPADRPRAVDRNARMPAAAQLSVQSLNDLAEADVDMAETAFSREPAPEIITPPMAAPATPAVKSAPKAAKAGLLAGISRRFMPSPKAEPVVNTGRTVVEPTPPIAPTDMVAEESENDLIEPGAGAPDVKKILERVRASQAAGEFDERGRSDRADYIAAARRAAKAAAQETDPSQPESRKNQRAAARAAARGQVQPQADGLRAKLAQHRRPIMMAVGAVLLALMSLQVVKNLSGHQAPQPSAIEAPAAPVTPPAVPVQPDKAGDKTGQLPATGNTATSVDNAPAAAPVETVTNGGNLPAATANGTSSMGTGQDSIPQPASQPGMAANSQLTDPNPTDGQAGGIQAPADEPAQSQGQAAGTFAPAPQAATAAPITVPAAIQPKSLADAAAAGDANALFEIGTRYTDGRGVKQDPAEAANWYRLAADRGLAPAEYRLANMYEKGTGIPRDLTKAMTYYRQAADAGNASAMHNLAVLYASGAAGQPDYNSAVQWFTKAADLGVADSQFNLAILYARGNGAKQDLEESYKWFAIAAQGGDKDASQKRDEVANAMRKEQLQDAKAKVDAWKVGTPDPKANTVNLPDEWSGKTVTTGSVDMSKAIRNIQAILNKNGFDAGTPDGKLGAKTISAIKAFQVKVGQQPDGRINDALVKELLARNK